MLAHGLDAIVRALLADHDVDLPLVCVGRELRIILGAQLHVRDQQVVDHLQNTGRNEKPPLSSELKTEHQNMDTYRLDAFDVCAGGSR